MDFENLLGEVVRDIDNFTREERGSKLLKTFKTMQANAIDQIKPKQENK